MARLSKGSAPAVGAILAACGLAQGQSFNFEPPTYTGSAAGTNIVGQDSWYTPAVANSTNGFVFTYTGNPYGVTQNPIGGTQFAGGECIAGSFVRMQRGVNFTGGSGVWEGIIDVNGQFSTLNGGVLPALDNLGSFSFQPTTARYYQTLMNWGSGAVVLNTYPGGPAIPNHSATGDFFHIAIGHATTANPNALSFSIPSADWMSRPVNTWYRTKLKWDFASSAVLAVSIQNLTAGTAPIETDVSARGWYLLGGLNSALPLPTDFRLFTGSAAVGNFVAWDNISLGPATVGSGACCMPTGGCQFLLQTACVSQGGQYAGDNVSCASANCPAAGRCCLFDGTCVLLTQTGCTNQNGVFTAGGNCSTACAAFGFSEAGNDAGDLPATATSINGNGQALTFITGTLDLDDVDMFKIKICDRPNFVATTNQSGTSTAIDSILFVFDLNGRGLVMSDDTSATVAQWSTITSLYIPSNGDYYLAISSFNNTAQLGRMPIDGSGQQLFTATNPANGQVYPEWQPTGPGAANPVAGWSGPTETGGQTYNILLTGACFLGGSSCYANCDGSTGSPLLTANDFQCFLNKYAANDTYANCDGSTGTPLLTANDFQCFLNKYAAGCT
jgi:hypothetical protein